MNAIRCPMAFPPAVLAVLLFVAGCGSSVPELADVSGTIKLDGKPLADASVMFIPENGRPSSGTTNSNGYYTMYYTEGVEGVLPGPARVMISTGASSKEDEDGNQTPGRTETVPAEYNVNSSLKFDVVKAESNSADFELTGGGVVKPSGSGENDAPARPGRNRRGNDGE